MGLGFEKETDGVLLLCAKEGLKNYFADKDFDYDFPEGILPLINAGIVIAVVTETCEEVQGSIINSPIVEHENYDLENHNLISQQGFYLAQADELYVLSHGEFTQICDSYKGDINSFSFWGEKIKRADLQAGWYNTSIYAKITDNEDELFLDIIAELIHTESKVAFDEITSIAAV